MNTISCIVIDDEPLAVQLMESYVRKTPFLELKGSFTNGKEAFAYLLDNPDAVGHLSDYRAWCT